MVDGIEEALAFMGLGEVSQLTIKYLDESDSSKLFYRIELLDIVQLSDEEMISLARTLKEKGNKEFLAKNLEKAKDMYRNGIVMIE